MEITFSDEEWEKIKEMVAASGENTISKFARMCLLNAGVVAIISDEDYRKITQLSKIGSNIWELRQQLYNAGVDGQILKDLETFRQQFSKILEFYKDKIDFK